MQQSGRVDSQIGKNLRFESSVNSEGIETLARRILNGDLFESSVNSEGIETVESALVLSVLFESSVNSEGIETEKILSESTMRLRAV